jgi:oxalate decarboxylase
LDADEVQDLDPDGTEFMLGFDDGTFSESGTVLLSDSISHIPSEVLAKNFGVSEQALQDLPNHELFIPHTAVPTQSKHLLVTVSRMQASTCIS